MAMVQGEWSTPQTNLTLVSATAGKIILVKRILFSTDQQGWFQMIGDPSGTPVDLTPAFYLAARREIDLELGDAYGIATASGVALGITTSTTTSPAGHGAIIWYEVVNA